VSGDLLRYAVRTGEGYVAVLDGRSPRDGGRQPVRRETRAGPTTGPDAAAVYPCIGLPALG